MVSGNAGSVSAGLQTSWSELDKVRLWVLMPLGSLIVRGIFYPTTLVKTRLQASSAYSGTRDAFRTIWRTEGPRALYKGFSVSLLGLFVGPVYISALEGSKSWLTSLAPKHDAAVMAVPMLAGGIASAVGQTLSVPVDIVSQRRMMQMSEAGASSSALDICQQLWKENGIRSFYRGYGMSLLTYVPSSSIIWGTVHLVQGPLGRVWPRAPRDESQPVSRWDGAFRDTVICMASGAVAGSTSAVLLAPFDVLRTRMQVLDGQPSGVAATARALVRERGLAGFASGATARVMSLGPLFTIIIGGYELIKRACAKDVSLGSRPE